MKQRFTQHRKLLMVIACLLLGCGVSAVVLAVHPGSLPISNALADSSGSSVPNTITLTGPQELWLQQESAVFSVTAPGADNVYLYEDGNPNQLDYGVPDAGTGIAEFTYGPIAQAGTKVFYAVAEYNGGSSIRSNDVSVLIKEPTDQLAAPTITASSPIAAGADIVFTVGAVDHADTYKAYIYDASYQNQYSAMVISPNVENRVSTATLANGAALPNGKYIIKVVVSGIGYLANGNTVQVHVGEVDKTVSLTVDKTEVFTEEEYVLTCVAPDADGVTIYKKVGEKENIWAHWDVGVDCGWVMTENKPVEISYRLEALYGEEWVKSGPVTVTATAPLGQVDPPVINTSAQIAEGEALTFSVSAVNNAASYLCNVFPSAGDTKIWNGNVTPGETITIPADKLSKGKYFIQVDVNAVAGAISNSNTVSVQVGQVDKTVSLTVDKTEVETHEEFNMNINASDADEVVIYRCENGTEKENGHWNTGYKDDWKCQESRVGTVTYRLEALFGKEWKTDTVSVKVTAPLGQLDKPVINVNAQVNEGDSATFSVSAVDHAEKYWYDVSTTDNKIQNGEITPGKEIEIPANKLSKGRYIIHVSVDGKGAESNWNEATFHVGEVDKTVSLAASATNVLTMQSYALTIDAKDADEVNLYCSWDNGIKRNQVYRWETGFSGDYNDSWALVGDVTYQVEAVYGSDTVYSDEVTLSVTAPYGPLAAPEISVPSRVDTGSDVTFTVSPVANATEYNVTVFQIKDDGNYGLSQYDSVGSITLQGLADGKYRIAIHAWAVGYELGYSEKTFSVGEVNKTVTLTATEQIKTGEDVAWTVTAPDADHVTLYIKDVSAGESEGNEWKWLDQDGGVSSTSGATLYFPLTRTYRLVATFGEETVEATATTVVTAPNGKLNAPTITAPEKLDLGQDLTFTVSTVNAAEHQYVYVFDGEMNRIAYSESAGQFTIPANQLTRGKYGIRSDVDAIGYEIGRVWAYVQIGEPLSISLSAAYADGTLTITASGDDVPTGPVQFWLDNDEIGQMTFSEASTVQYKVELQDGTHSVGMWIGRETFSAQFQVGSAAQGIPGDANDDGSFGLNDVMLMIDAYCDPSVQVNQANCDMDGDSQLTLSDIMLAIDAYCGSI